MHVVGSAVNFNEDITSIELIEPVRTDSTNPVVKIIKNK